MSSVEAPSWAWADPAGKPNRPKTAATTAAPFKRIVPPPCTALSRAAFAPVGAGEAPVRPTPGL